MLNRPNPQGHSLPKITLGQRGEIDFLKSPEPSRASVTENYSERKGRESNPQGRLNLGGLADHCHHQLACPSRYDTESGTRTHIGTMAPHILSVICIPIPSSRRRLSQLFTREMNRPRTVAYRNITDLRSARLLRQSSVEGIRSTYCLWAGQGLNLRPSLCKRDALPAELPAYMGIGN